MGEAKRRDQVIAGWRDALAAKFPPGTWVFGVGQHQGCSEVFIDRGGQGLQPFDYLNDYDIAHYRAATPAEVMEAMDRVMGQRLEKEKAQ